VGGRFSTEFTAYDHLERMLSLDNAFSEEDLRGWAERLRQLDVPTFVYLRHEDEPTAARYAERLVELLS
jgi:DNA ligase (NAD+)